MSTPTVTAPPLLIPVKPLSPKAAGAIRLSRKHRLSIWEGSVRSGKTVGSLLRFTEMVIASTGGLAIVGSTADTISRNIIKPLRDMYGEANVKEVRGLRILWLFGKRVDLIGANTEDAEFKIRGLTLEYLYVDEASIIPRSAFLMGLSRLSYGEDAACIATTNPDSPMHWLLTDYLNNAETTIEQDGRVTRSGNDSGIARFRFTVHDNPSLSKAWLKSLPNLYKGLWYKRFVEGAWVSALGAVYPMLDYSHGSRMTYSLQPDTNPDVNVLPTVDEFTAITCGIDWGMSNPTHAVVIGIARRKIWVLGEHVITDPMSVAAQVASIDGWLRAGCPAKATGRPVLPVIDEGDPYGVDARYTVVVDPSAAAFRTEWALTHVYGDKVDNAQTAGIAFLSTLFDTGRLLLNPEDCTPVLGAQLTGLTWDPKKTADGMDQVIKKDDHGPDALRYACMRLQQSV